MSSRTVTATPDQWRYRALAAERGGDRAHARTLIERGLAEHPGDADLANSAANFAMRAGDFAAAANLFQTAATLKPDSLEYALNQAIALNRLERFAEALAVLSGVGEAGKRVARFCSTRATAERGAGNLRTAGEWFDRCLALEPAHVRALHGRARLALERGEDDALARFDSALTVNQGDADLWLGRAQALDVAGRTDEAREIAEALVIQAPQWPHGTRFLAQLKLAADEADYDCHYAAAAEKLPQDPNIRADHAELLAGQDRFLEAADVLARARQDFPAIGRFALLEAVHAGAAGDDDRAEAIWNTLSAETAEERLHLARHRLRRGELERAEDLLDALVRDDPRSIGAWALRGVLWRLTSDAREAWLHRQDGLIALIPLHDADQVLPPAIARLHELHETSAFPLGQSLRGGTQTRALLFERAEPEFSALRYAIVSTLKSYRDGLPATDPEHPILRHRNSQWSVGGSWSVRLAGGGDRHASHFHPLGTISSALYIESPLVGGADPQAGWLELGRPPDNLRTDLEPLTAFPPRAGHLALFPSTLYHGTRPFSRGRRLTVAFDVTASQEPL